MRLMTGVRCAVALVTCWSLGTFAAAAATIPIFVVGSGRPNPSSAIVRGGQVFVPLRGVVDRAGTTPEYRNPNRVRFLRGGRVAASIVVGSRNATVAGRPRALAVAPFSKHGSIYVPLTFVTQALGGDLVVGRNPLRVTVTPPLPGGGSPPRGGAPAAAPPAAAVPATTSGGVSPLRIVLVLVVLALCAIAAAYVVWRDRRRSEPVVISEAYDDVIPAP